MLLETSGVTRLSLLFGSTWVVNAVVIAVFIFMAVLANAFVMVKPLPRWMAYAGLFFSLGVSTLFPYHVLDALAAVQKVMASAALIGLPVFFSGMVFSRSFRDFANPSEALGVNLLGAVVGGTLENVVMIGGIAILSVLVVMLYALSAAFIWNPKPTTEFAKAVAVLDPGQADSHL